MTLFLLCRAIRWIQSVVSSCLTVQEKRVENLSVLTVLFPTDHSCCDRLPTAVRSRLGKVLGLSTALRLFSTEHRRWSGPRNSFLFMLLCCSVFGFST